MELVVGISGDASLDLAQRTGADGIMAIDPEADLVDGWAERGGDRGATWTEVPFAWAPTEEEGLRLAHERMRFALPGWKVMSELPNPVNFAAATEPVRPEDVAEQIPHGPDPKAYVEADPVLHRRRLRPHQHHPGRRRRRGHPALLARRGRSPRSEPSLAAVGGGAGRFGPWTSVATASGPSSSTSCPRPGRSSTSTSSTSSASGRCGCPRRWGERPSPTPLSCSGAAPTSPSPPASRPSGPATPWPAAPPTRPSPRPTRTASCSAWA